MPIVSFNPINEHPLHFVPLFEPQFCEQRLTLTGQKAHAHQNNARHRVLPNPYAATQKKTPPAASNLRKPLAQLHFIIVDPLTFCLHAALLFELLGTLRAHGLTMPTANFKAAICSKGHKADTNGLPKRAGDAHWWWR